MPIRDRRRLGVRNVVSKRNEINNSLITYYVSIILFGLFSLASLPAALFAPDIYSLLIFVLSGFIAIQSVKGMLKLKRFNKEYEQNPEGMANTPVPKPMLYQAVFWYLPK